MKRFVVCCLIVAQLLICTKYGSCDNNSESSADIQLGSLSLQSKLRRLEIQLTGLQSQLVGQQAQLTTQNKLLEGQQKQLEGIQTHSVPIGFVYVQLSGQPEPSTMWPQTQWENISSTYAGLFFRVLGGGSAAFGETQNENSPRITEIKNDSKGYHSHHINVPANDEWTAALWTGSDLWCVSPSRPCYWSMYFKQSAGEVRPRNQAVKIWKRVE